MYVYNISDGVANIFYQSCAQIDNNQHVYEAQIQVSRCNSTHTTVPRQLILMYVCCLPFGQDLAFG